MLIHNAAAGGQQFTEFITEGSRRPVEGVGKVENTGSGSVFSPSISSNTELKHSGSFMELKGFLLHFT